MAKSVQNYGFVCARNLTDSAILSRGVVKKLLGGYQKQLTEVKLGKKHLTEYLTEKYCIYIFDPADLFTFSEAL